MLDFFRSVFWLGMGECVSEKRSGKRDKGLEGKMERQRSAAGGWVCRYINANIYNTPTDTGKGVGGGKDGKGKKTMWSKKKAVVDGLRSEWKRPRGKAKNREK